MTGQAAPGLSQTVAIRLGIFVAALDRWMAAQ